jgi:hypothetical protein
LQKKLVGTILRKIAKMKRREYSQEKKTYKQFGSAQPSQKNESSFLKRAILKDATESGQCSFVCSCWFCNSWWYGIT